MLKHRVDVINDMCLQIQHSQLIAPCHTQSFSRCSVLMSHSEAPPAVQRSNRHRWQLGAAQYVPYSIGKY